MIEIHVSDEQTALDSDPERLQATVERILRDAGLREAEVSLAIVDDPTIHQLNRQFLEHDYPTDVLSFLLERSAERLEGEVIASADTAIRAAAEFGWAPADELLLYVIHGTLHLVGYDDLAPGPLAEMREQERVYLQHFGLKPRYS
jgi:probable rRNA maturation factor